MFTVLAVDDEKLELEAMKKLVRWQDADAVLIGTACNGEEGLAKIKALRPDIVITDIRMPKLDGISMIDKALAENPGTLFIVLSGYGEYEYTSRAMELGIRHYILKPIDEKKILETLRKAEEEKMISDKEAIRQKGQEDMIKRLEPSARRGFFARALKGSVSADEADFYSRHLKLEKGYGLFAFTVAGSTGEDTEEELMKVAAQILGRKSPLNTESKGIFYFLIYASQLDQIEMDARLIRQYAVSQGFRDIRFALSDTPDIPAARHDVENLLSQQWKEGRLVQSSGRISTEEMEALLRRKQWSQIRNCEALYHYASTFDLMMKAAGYNDSLRRVAVSSFAFICSLEHAGGTEREDIFSLCEKAYMKNIEENEEEKKDRMILRFIFLHIADSMLSLSLTAQEAAYMNEDYFSRYFQKKEGMKFSRFVTRKKMDTAMDILCFFPSVPLPVLAVLSGYQEDGQYFQKVFKDTFDTTINNARSRFFSQKN